MCGGMVNITTCYSECTSFVRGDPLFYLTIAMINLVMYILIRDIEFKNHASIKLGLLLMTILFMVGVFLSMVLI